MTLAIATVANADSKAVATVSVDGAAPESIVIPAAPSGNGLSLYNATIVVPGTDVTVTWNYVLDDDPANNASFNGTTTILNQASRSRIVTTSIDFDLCPVITHGSLVGCIASLKGINNSNGGTISCGIGSVLAQTTYDGEFGNGLYFCPFNMSSSAAGTVTTSINFGTPVPGLPGPEKISTIGTKLDLTITDGDKAILNTYFGAAVDGQVEEAETTCTADLNGDGTVNEIDLTMLLNLWGLPGGCGAADFNGNGFVDAQDMSVVLNNWGDCVR